MRCKICEIPHKNTSRHENWVEYGVCRGCSFVLEMFSWNGYNLGEYWENGNV